MVQRTPRTRTTWRQGRHVPPNMPVLKFNNLGACREKVVSSGYTAAYAEKEIADSMLSIVFGIETGGRTPFKEDGI